MWPLLHPAADSVVCPGLISLHTCSPFTLATSLGLASVAMDLPLTASEAGDGLVPPAVAVYILGKSGAVWLTM